MVRKKKSIEEDLEQNRCCNPFRKKRCGNPDIAVYIRKDGVVYPICLKCWIKIADSDLEWSSDDK